tara:strand:+ start:236 stop:409 length:174 start_codon:yes stop_codon:yes gene_type:complete
MYVKQSVVFTGVRKEYIDKKDGASGYKFDVKQLYKAPAGKDTVKKYMGMERLEEIGF